MRVLIFGVGGMLGHKLYQRMTPRFEVVGTLRSDLARFSNYGIFHSKSIIENVDVTQHEQVSALIQKVRPDCVVNAVGIIKQLPEASNVITALGVNSIFPQRLAEMSSELGFRLITISTDCVFDGKKGNYAETDLPDARDIYGLSKYLGETDQTNALTIRTSIIGRELGTSHSIVEWFLNNRGGAVKGYTKALYTGFPTIFLADIISDLIERQVEMSGVWHVSSDAISKYDLLRLLNEAFAARVDIEPSDDVAIDRSLDSRRFRTKTGWQPRGWPEMVATLASDDTKYEI